MKIFLIIFIAASLSGCSSAGMNGMCGRITGTEMTVPYVAGKANVDGYACHIGCFGLNCGKPDYKVLQSVMNSYAEMETTLGKITTTSAGTITFTPLK